jgi:hypothetical protein
MPSSAGCPATEVCGVMAGFWRGGMVLSDV